MFRVVWVFQTKKRRLNLQYKEKTSTQSYKTQIQFFTHPGFDYLAFEQLIPGALLLGLAKSRNFIFFHQFYSLRMRTIFGKPLFRIVTRIFANFSFVDSVFFSCFSLAKSRSCDLQIAGRFKHFTDTKLKPKHCLSVVFRPTTLS